LSLVERFLISPLRYNVYLHYLLMKKGISDMYLAEPRVLDLSNTSITSLPSYISSLSNLRGLYLNNFRKHVVLHSEVGSLVKLEDRNVEVKSLPVEIRNLNCPMSLVFLNGFTELIKFPVGVITDLITLEQLVMEVNLEKKWWVLYWMGWLV
jgi:hypothetical protein